MFAGSLAGTLLVASPALDDPNFSRTVILILDHDSEGALGVVLNRPSEIAAEDALPRWAEAASAPAVVHVGGPVTPEAVVCLARMRPTSHPPTGWTPLAGVVGALDLDSEPADVLDRLDAFRVFAGYSGWGPGQLETELRLGGWMVLNAEPEDAFSPAPEKLWSQVLRRQRGDLALLHTMPVDPTNN